MAIYHSQILGITLYYSEHNGPQKILGGLEWISRIPRGSFGVYPRVGKVPSSFRSERGDPLNNPERMEHLGIEGLQPENKIKIL